MILNRSQFIDYFNGLRPGLGDPDSALWIPEEEESEASQWFVCVKPMQVRQYKIDFWQWCHQHLSGKIYCYSSDDKHQEWWGFTDHRDIALWLLKWA